MRRSIRIECIQSTASFNEPINCLQLSQLLPSSKYNETTPHRLDYFMTEPKCRMVLFNKKGTMFMMGCKSVSAAIEAHKQFTFELIGAGLVYDIESLLNIPNPEPKINNISASGYVGHHVWLDAFANHPYHEDNCTYLNESFPGLRYRCLLPSINPSINATIFHSGKVILLGCKEEDHVIQAFDRLLKICQPFAIENTFTGDHVIQTNIQGVDKMRRHEQFQDIYEIV